MNAPTSITQRAGYSMSAYFSASVQQAQGKRSPKISIPRHNEDKNL